MGSKPAASKPVSASREFEESQSFTAYPQSGLERYHVECRPAGTRQAWRTVSNSNRKSARQAATRLANAARKYPANEYRIIRIVTIREEITL